MKGFWELLKQSVIVQAIIALMLLATICYMYATNQPVPENLVTFSGVVLGFYFGSKAQQTISRR